MSEPAAQRFYRAPCPACGAPVEFKSAQSTHAVCAYCQSTVVREGDVLKRIGKMAELFDDHSLLQLGASGQIDGQSFTLVGRLQYKYPEGTWTEWHALLADGSSAWLSEDNGAYVFSRPVAAQREVPAAERFVVGASTALGGQRYAVTSNTTVALISAQGELPRLPPLGETFAVVELRTQGGGAAAQRVFSVDYGSAPPLLSEGRAVALADLNLSGLKHESGKESKGRQFACPNCGSPVLAKLDSTKSITCPQCNTLIDLSAGIGGELRHAVQDEPVRPLIALGSVGRLEGASWQAVGFQHRLGQSPDDDESFGWSEYLLYNANKGFCFLVDAEDGWSLVKPTTGAPERNLLGQSVTYQNVVYQKTWAYRAETSYVLGEFYWQVQRGQVTQNTDYAAGDRLLSSEQSASEITWSAGRKMSAQTVADAFKLADKKDLFKRADAQPLSAVGSANLLKVVIVVVIVLLVMMLIVKCVEDSAGGGAYSGRSAGGSYGGASSGGGHK
ncbi:DUF4178 domain-containing protein [Ottowia testudinis]|uniref:DUF4178 domain-containing protein n=1 Tax=Ottowia testudinis TaxID=2816950 RepID=A0A975CIG1_9BURK|nr:DUF4178 domain-containing protein [Ottowia testudinis]QTD45547.1 DUF4178 domain-containing protein [Ottowia testudinis]